jgi:hypothetical protein
MVQDVLREGRQADIQTHEQGFRTVQKDTTLQKVQNSILNGSAFILK